jgi:MinD superfamily P-loop ATPase
MEAANTASGLILTVTAGKGGTGKTTVAVNLALSVARDLPVQFLDLDVEEPDAHILLKPDIAASEPVRVLRPRVDEGLCDYCGDCARYCEFHALAVFGKQILVFNDLCHGCGLCQQVCPRSAIKEYGAEIGVLERGGVSGFEFLQGTLEIGQPLATPIIRQLKRRIESGKLAILDSPPGTGCPVIEAMQGSDFVLLVTEPTPFGLHDLKLSVAVARELNVKIGVVINRDGVGDRGVERYCAEEDIPILLRIPMDRRIAELYSRGIPFVLEMPEWRERFREMLALIRDYSMMEVTTR